MIPVLRRVFDAGELKGLWQRRSHLSDVTASRKHRFRRSSEIGSAQESKPHSVGRRMLTDR